MQSSKEATKTPEAIPSSTPPICPTSASTVIFLEWAYSTTSFVILIFSSKLYLEASIITDENPESIAFLQLSTLDP